MRISLKTVRFNEEFMILEFKKPIAGPSSRGKHWLTPEGKQVQRILTTVYKQSNFNPTVSVGNETTFMVSRSCFISNPSPDYVKELLKRRNKRQNVQLTIDPQNVAGNLNDASVDVPIHIGAELFYIEQDRGEFSNELQFVRPFELTNRLRVMGPILDPTYISNDKPWGKLTLIVGFSSADGPEIRKKHIAAAVKIIKRSKALR